MTTVITSQILSLALRSGWNLFEERRKLMLSLLSLVSERKGKSTIMVSQIRKPEQTKMTTQLPDVGLGRFRKIDLSFDFRKFVMGTLGLVWSHIWGVSLSSHWWFELDVWHCGCLNQCEDRPLIEGDYHILQISLGRIADLSCDH
jgi:hypothetical protein